MTASDPEVASDLFVAGDGELPSVAQIAVAAGLAKGTVYLYFRTKGAIFISILQDGWSDVVGDLERTFQPADGAQSDNVAAFLSSYFGCVECHLELLQLDSLGTASSSATWKRKHCSPSSERSWIVLWRAAMVLESALGLSPGRRLQLLTRIHAMTRRLWHRSTMPSIRPGSC